MTVDSTLRKYTQDFKRAAGPSGWKSKIETPVMKTWIRSRDSGPAPVYARGEWDPRGAMFTKAKSRKELGPKPQAATHRDSLAYQLFNSFRRKNWKKANSKMMTW